MALQALYAEKLQEKVTESMNCGIAQFNCQQYEQAAVSFGSALSESIKYRSSIADVVGIEDYLAATQLKMKQLEAARKTATSMIQKAKTDARGYLRVAQAERLDGKEDDALRWYKHGLKNASPNDSLRTQLQTLFDKTLLRIQMVGRPESTADPVKVLPMDALELICSFLLFREVVAVLRVSKMWQSAFTAVESNWRILDFSYASSKTSGVSVESLRSCLRKCRRPPSTFNTGNLSAPALAYLKKLLPSWTDLEHFEARTSDVSVLGLSWWRFSKLKVLTFMSDRNGALPVKSEWVFDILLRCCSLEKAVFCEMTDSLEFSLRHMLEVHETLKDKMLWPKTISRLRYLTIHGRLSGGKTPSRLRDFPTDFLARFPYLEQLTLTGINFEQTVWSDSLDLSGLQHLQSVDLSHSRLRVAPLLPGTIRHIKFDELDLIDWTSAPRPAAKIVPLLNLQSFSAIKTRVHFSPLWYWVLISEGGVETALESLDLYDARMEINDLWTLFRKGLFARLKHLRLKDPRLSDDLQHMFLQYCPNLETLELTAAYITAVFISVLIRAKESKLRKVILISCHNVSPDIVGWAKTQGVEVHWRNSEDDLKKGTKRVRDVT